MAGLTEQSCEACRADAPLLSEAEIGVLMQELPEWVLEVDRKEPCISRVYSFRNFVEALAFTNKVGELAELHGHHPLIALEWGKVSVSWWTHKIKGLHKNDMIMAAKTDAAYSV